MKQTVISSLNKVLSPSLKNKIFHLGFNLAGDEFRHFAHEYAFAPIMEPNLAKLRSRGLDPSHIVDVGAFHGEWSQMAHRLWPQASLTMVEGNDAKHAHLSDVAQDLKATLHMALLGPETGKEVTFYVMESGSSILEENSPVDREPVTKSTYRLDDLLAGAPVDLLKLDVQGFELEVLRGAPHVLSQVSAVLLEVSLIEINKGAPLFAEVVGFMAERDFEVIDVLELHRRPLDQATNQVDLCFVPKSSPFLADKRHFA